ncbi:MAG: hypothetical protein CMH98_08955 [Oceanospirillaceae bacterium]|nr:hypothetical protein [Oceanospirillaceae bacterium]|tara:strand:- start:119240 stop:119458 length:219 start_codon:yes stop_codon:yes gene_type:complete
MLLLISRFSFSQGSLIPLSLSPAIKRLIRHYRPLTSNLAAYSELVKAGYSGMNYVVFEHLAADGSVYGGRAR